MTSQLLASAITERNAARQRVAALEREVADLLIQRREAMEKANEVSAYAADLIRRVDFLETRARRAESGALDDGWVGDYARGQAQHAAERLHQRCREVATSREMARWTHETGGEVYPQAAELLCWLIDQHDQLGTPILARGRDYVALLSVLGFLSRVPEALAMQFSLRDLERLQIVEESREQRTAVVEAIDKGSVA